MGESILRSLRDVSAERQARAADAAFGQRVAAIKHYQHGRFSHTYADLLSSKRYGGAAKFFLEDLYGHNDWSNARIVTQCQRLTDAQLDQPREMGFGALRNTLFHILAAEEIWFERWNSSSRAIDQHAATLGRDGVADRSGTVGSRTGDHQPLSDHENAPPTVRIAAQANYTFFMCLFLLFFYSTTFSVLDLSVAE